MVILLRKLTQLPTYSPLFFRFFSNAPPSSKPLKIIPTESFVDLRQKGGYYLDKTHFIPEIENLDFPSTLSLCPHGFGKTLFLSTLSSYYDRQNNKDQFKQLFGDLYIGKNPTPLASSFFVLNFDFSELYNRVTAYENFEMKFNKTLNMYMTQFADKYGYHFGIDKSKSAVENFSTLLERTGRAPYGYTNKIYVFIDNTVNKNLKDETILQAFTAYQRSFNQLYSDLKYACDKGVARTFQTGVIPLIIDFNNLNNLALKITFWDLYGFKESEIEFLLNNTTLENDLSTDVKKEIMKWLKEENNRYFFNCYQTEGIFNPSHIQYYFKKLIEQKKFLDKTFYKNYSTSVIMKALLDFPFDLHTLPSQNLIVNNPFTSDHNLSLSYMFYTGALTYKPDLSSITSQYKFQIPSHTKKEFIIEILNTYDWEEKDLTSVQECLQVLERKDDIKPLCQFVEQALLKSLKGNNFKYSNEDALKQVFMDTLILALHKPEFRVNFQDLNLGEKVIDLVKTSSKRRTVIEFDDIKMECIKLDGIWRNATEVEMSLLLLEKSEDEILRLEINDQYQPKLKTVDEALKWYIKMKSKKSLEPLERQDECLNCSFVILRVGLYRLISRRVYCANKEFERRINQRIGETVDL